MAKIPYTASTPIVPDGGSTTTTTTTTTATSPYAQFKGNNYAELEEFLQNQMKTAKVETPEEREKREKREKRTMFLARLADGLGTFHTAFAHARGVKPMELPSMSAKARERFDKAKAERDKDNDRLVNYAITLGKIKDADRDFNFRVTQAEQQQSNWREQFDAGRKDRADDVAFRDKKFEAGRKDRADDVAFRDKQFEEGRRQFNVSSAEQRRHNRASEGLERKRFAASQDGKYTEFYSGNGMVRIPNTRLNQHNLSYIYRQIRVPETDKEGNATGKYTTMPLTTEDINGKVTPVSAEQMMQAIGAHIDDPNVQSALRAIGGEQVSKKKPLPGSETNGKKPLP